MFQALREEDPGSEKRKEEMPGTALECAIMESLPVQNPSSYAWGSLNLNSVKLDTIKNSVPQSYWSLFNCSLVMHGYQMGQYRI